MLLRGIPAALHYCTIITMGMMKPPDKLTKLNPSQNAAKSYGNNTERYREGGTNAREPDGLGNLYRMGKMYNRFLLERKSLLVLHLHTSQLHLWLNRQGLRSSRPPSGDLKSHKQPASPSPPPAEQQLRFSHILTSNAVRPRCRSTSPRRAARRSTRTSLDASFPKQRPRGAAKFKRPHLHHSPASNVANGGREAQQNLPNFFILTKVRIALPLVHFAPSCQAKGYTKRASRPDARVL